MHLTWKCNCKVAGLCNCSVTAASKYVRLKSNNADNSTTICQQNTAQSRPYTGVAAAGCLRLLKQINRILPTRPLRGQIRSAMDHAYTALLPCTAVGVLFRNAMWFRSPAREQWVVR